MHVVLIKKRRMKGLSTLILLDTMMRNESVWMNSLHIDTGDIRSLSERSQCESGIEHYRRTVDIVHDTRKYHNWINLLNNPMDIVFRIDSSMDTIDIDKQDNHSNQSDSQADNLMNIRTISDSSKSELN